jgi:AcrR family transcriptional regulator
MSPRPTLKKQHPNLQDAIKETAWAQIAESGAATLSLRAIARELKITAPAIYNYFADRDALVTALIVDAYASLGDTQADSLTDLPADDHVARLTALGRAYRQWAVTYPQRYLLIFGTPIPGYHAPDETTNPVAARALTPLIMALQAAFDADALRVERLAKLTPKLKSMLNEWKKVGAGADLDVLYLAIIFWSRMHGLALLEIGNHLPPSLVNSSEMFEREIKTMMSQYL